jgi:hypothetical protein
VKKEELVVGMQFLADGFVATVSDLRSKDNKDDVQIFWMDIKADFVGAPNWHSASMILDCVNKYGWQVLSSLHKELL